MIDVAVNPAPARNAAGRTRFRDGEAGVMKSWSRGGAVFIAVSLRPFPGEHPSSFPPLAMGGPGGVDMACRVAMGSESGVASAQAITEFSKGFLTRLAASCGPVATDGKTIHDVRGVRPFSLWPPHKEGFSSPPCPRRGTGPHPGMIFRRAAGGQDGQHASRCAANHWLRPLRRPNAPGGLGRP